MTLDDDKLDAMLRSCGEEARTASHRLLESGLHLHRDAAVKRAAAEALKPQPFWQRLLPRPSGAVFSPFSGMAVACALILAFVMTLNIRANEPRQNRLKTLVVADRATTGDDSESLAADGEMLAAYRGLSGSLPGEEEEEIEAGDDDADSLPDYYSLDLETVQTDYSEEEDDDYAFENA